jgi:hypothetical protein
MSFTFSNPLFHGIRDLLFNGEVGLLVFAPWVVLVVLCFPRFMRMHLPEAVLCAGVSLITLLFYAKYEQWHGGWAGGPRYLLPILPFLIMVIVPTVEILRMRVSMKGNQKFWTVVHSFVVLMLVAGFIIQVVTVSFPRDRYYALTMFYRNRPLKPWWTGSIPLASVDYWFQTSIPKTETTGAEPGRSLTVAPVVSDSRQVDRLQWPWALADTTSTEDGFLSLFPNPENLVLPELLVLKRRLMGLPVRAIEAYVVAVLIMILAGVLGLKRDMGSHEIQSPASLDGRWRGRITASRGPAQPVVVGRRTQST